MEKCVIYSRFSSYGQNEQSIEAQLRICKEFAESKGLTVINNYADRAKTGMNDDRPAFQRMIADAKSGAFQYIIVYMFDRFARNRRDSIMYKELLKEKYGIKVVSALEPIADDEGGEFYEMFLDWNAEKYSKRLSKRVLDGLDTSAANGTFCGGSIIYGYKVEQEPIKGRPNKFLRKVAIVDEEAEIVRYVFEEYNKGVAKKEIAMALNRQGNRLRGKEFKGRSFDTWLLNRKYTGDFVFGDRPCDNMYPAIIGKEIFDSVNARLAKNRYAAGGRATAKIPYLLTGKLFCGVCGSPMVADGGTGGGDGTTAYRYYTCRKKKTHECDKLREHKGNLEDYVYSCTVDYLSDKNNADMVSANVLAYYRQKTCDGNIKSVAMKISNARKEISEMTDIFIKAKSALIQASIEEKMVDYEILLKDLYLQQSKLELERGYMLTKKDILTFIAETLRGDPDDKEYQRSIIDVLVDKVYVGVENILIIFNILGDDPDGIVKFDEIQAALTEDSEVHARSFVTHH